MSDKAKTANPKAEERKRRLAEQLRENLRKRKRQQREAR